ncbi:MAG: transposase, partial [Chloroflexota bacterium]
FFEARMRGKVERQVTMLSSLTPDELVPRDHPIRHIKPIVDEALSELSLTFSRMYAEVGRPSIPPEHLLEACLLIVLYSIRSERQFCERLQYDLLFKWFLDLNIMDPAFDSTTFNLATSPHIITQQRRPPRRPRHPLHHPHRKQYLATETGENRLCGYSPQTVVSS